MIKEDLWSEPADDFGAGDVEISSKAVEQVNESSFNGSAPLSCPRRVLKKIVLTKIDEQRTAIQSVSESVAQTASSSISSNTMTTTGDIDQLHRASFLDPSSSLDPRFTSAADSITDDLWSDIGMDTTVIDPPLTETLLQDSSFTAEISEIDQQPSLEATKETGVEAAYAKDDLWTLSEDEGKQLAENECEEEEAEPGEWGEDATSHPEEEPEQEQEIISALHNSFLMVEDYSVNIPEASQHSGNLADIVDFAEMDGPNFLSNSFALIDIQAELAELERAEAEAELATQVSETERVAQSVGKHRRGQAPGWMGSTSLLYVDWEEGEKAEQEALERLGYAHIRLSQATRAFILQAARAYKLTLNQERQLTARLEDARCRLAQFSDEDDYIQQRNDIQAEIAEIERTLTQNFQWVAVKKAKNFLGQGLSLDDLIQYGMLGVIAGIRHFNRSRNTRLMVVINWWVFQVLTRAMSEYIPLIRLPIYVHEALATLKSQLVELEYKLGSTPALEELADAAQLSTKQVESLLGAEKRVISLDYYVKKEHASDGYSFQTVEECLIAQEEGSLPDEGEQIDIQRRIEALLAVLKAREREVIRLRYDLDQEYGEMRTLEEIGKRMHITRERVRQIEERALRKIRVHLGIQQQWVAAQVIGHPKKNKK